MAAMHGDEPKTTYVVARFAEWLRAGAAGRGGVNVSLVPIVNPDGYFHYKRRNAHKVDLNRNFPTKDWVELSRRSRYYSGPAPASEPETRALVRLIGRIRPTHIVTLHSITLRRQCNNYNGRAAGLARRLAKHNGYPVTGDIGYPTPGSFGTWAGLEQDIPTVTLELPSHTSRQRDWQDNAAALAAAIEG